MKKYMTSMSLALCGVFSSITSVFAGDKLINFNVISTEVSNKPNTGDTNTLIIYGSIAVVALLALIFVNLKSSKKKNNDEQQTNDSVEENEDN